MKDEYTVNYDQSRLLFCVGDLPLPVRLSFYMLVCDKDIWES